MLEQIAEEQRFNRCPQHLPLLLTPICRPLVQAALLREHQFLYVTPLLPQTGFLRWNPPMQKFLHFTHRTLLLSDKHLFLSLHFMLLQVAPPVNRKIKLLPETFKVHYDLALRYVTVAFISSFYCYTTALFQLFTWCFYLHIMTLFK